MDTNSYYAHQSPQQRSPSDPFHRYTPSDQFSPPATSHTKNFQSTTDNPFYRRTSVAEYASLPGSAAKIPALKQEEPEIRMRHRRSLVDPIMSEEAEDVHMKSEHEHDDSSDGWQPEPAPSKPRRGRKPKQEAEEEVGPARAERDIEVKTKFPVARIKRIMQADEDVGKVAQVTPVAVSKALELFMISIITSAASEARDRGQKRVGAAHLKNTILKEQKFDFLTDIANRVPDASAKSGSGDEGKGKTKGRRKRKDEN